MGEIRIRPGDRPGDLGWIVQAHGELYAAEHGWDATFEAHVAGSVARMGALDPARERLWVADLDGRRVGCVACTTGSESGAAQLRILLLHPDARGQGLGTRLVRTCVEFARGAGYRRLDLWTVDALAAARRVYLAAGFRVVREERQRRFGTEVLGQDYSLDLAGNSTA
jgi:GNAT superfamily N-acetyltransferase